MRGSDQKLDALIVASAHVLIEENARYLRDIDVSDVVVSPKVKHRIQRKIRRHERAEAWREIPPILKRTVAAILVLCTISFGLCMSVEAIRATIWSTLMEWFDRYVAVYFISDDTPPNILEEELEPTRIPKDAEKQYLTQTDTGLVICYYLDEVPVAMYSQLLLKDRKMNIDNEDCIIKTIRIRGYKAQLFRYDDGKINLIWHDRSYAYILSSWGSQIDAEFLISMAESVK